MKKVADCWLPKTIQDKCENPRFRLYLFFPLERENVCFFLLQLRLDFSSFIITGPSTSTTSVLKTIGGQVKKKVIVTYEFIMLNWHVSWGL